MQREELNFLLQQVQKEQLKNLYEKINNDYEVKVLQPPTAQTLLQPVSDPISQGEFYSGEVLVTTTIVSINKTKGWAMVMDENDELSLYIAVADAAFETDIFKNEIIALAKSAKEDLVQTRQTLNKKVNATRVHFDLM